MGSGRIIGGVGRVAAAVLVALALMLTAWGHQPLRPGPDMAAYAMPDGTLPDLCLTQDGDAPATHDPCPVCTLTAPVCPPQSALADLMGTVRLADWHWAAAHLRAAGIPRAPPARGPPLPPLV